MPDHYGDHGKKKKKLPKKRVSEGSVRLPKANQMWPGQQFGESMKDVPEEPRESRIEAAAAKGLEGARRMGMGAPIEMGRKMKVKKGE